MKNMVSSILKVGDKLDIRILQQVETQKEMGGIPPKILKSVIYDIKEDGTLEIGMPTEAGKMVLLTLGLRYDVVFYAKGSLYRATGLIKERYKSDNLYMASMELVTGLTKFQRREYYRFECLLDIDYVTLSTQEADMIEKQILEAEDMLEYHTETFPEDGVHSGIAVDISGGGVRFVSEEKIPAETSVLIHLRLISESGQREFWVPGIILQGRKREGDMIKYEYRVMFCLKDNKVREHIIKYIFEEERKNRKNEKG